MIAINHRDNLPLGIWYRDNSVSEASLNAIIYDYALLETTYNKLSKKRSKVFRKKFVVAAAICAIPILISILILAVTMYLLSVPVFRVYFSFLNKKAIDLKLSIQKSILTNTVSKEKLIRNHTSTVQIIEKLYSKLDGRLATEKLIMPSIIKVLNTIKEIELIQRVGAYPERNEVVLTYDELKELSAALKDFEPAEEQSNIYHS